MSLSSVKRIAQEGPVMHVNDAAERAQRQVGRPSTVTNFRKPILEILQHTPDLASLEILRRVRETGYEGGKTTLYALSPRSARTRPSRWFVSKVCMILDKSKRSSSMGPASASIFSPRV